jgi:dihydrofolate reductase
MIRLIVAMDRKLGIAKHGIMPWYIPQDEDFFTEKTKTYGGNVLSGAKTYSTYSGPLKDRLNYVLTHDSKPIEGAILVNALESLINNKQIEDLWVAGGANVFKQIIESGYADELYLTQIDADFNCDKFFPEYEEQFLLKEKSQEHEQNGFKFTFCTYSKKA